MHGSPYQSVAGRPSQSVLKLRKPGLSTRVNLQLAFSESTQISRDSKMIYRDLIKLSIERSFAETPKLQGTKGKDSQALNPRPL